VRVLAIALVLAGCGDNLAAPHDASTDAPPPDAGAPARVATGTHVVTHPAVVGGITADHYIAFFDTDASAHSVAKVIPVAGGTETTISTSDGTGKPDVRFETWGGVVFAWTDRGNRVAKLAMWSQAAGVVDVGMGVRPGRAAATADGAHVLFERDITTTTASIVAGPIAGPVAMLASADSQDTACWQNTDLMAVGDRFLVRYCPAGATAFTLRSYAADLASYVELSTSAELAIYGKNHVVWRDATGALASAAPDGTAITPLAQNATDAVLSADETEVAYRTTAGAILAVSIAGGTPRTLVASGAQLLGALSPDRQTALYATQIDDRGSGFVQPYTDARAGATILASAATTCAGCLVDSFSTDSKTALLLDPIDNSTTADGAGPIRFVDVATGATIASVGSVMYNALAAGDRFLLLDATRDTTLSTGWSYGLTLRGTAATDEAQPVASGAEDFAIDHARATAIVSFSAGDDGLTGLWVVAL
jgi:hypothetical protein